MKRSSERRAKDLADGLLRDLRAIARKNGSIAMSDEAFWDILRSHYGEIANLAALVSDEVENEREAKTDETRTCIVCDGPVVKRHVRGRWPLYCDTCSLKDRKSPSTS